MTDSQSDPFFVLPEDTEIHFRRYGSGDSAAPSPWGPDDDAKTTEIQLALQSPGAVGLATALLRGDAIFSNEETADPMWAVNDWFAARGVEAFFLITNVGRVVINPACATACSAALAQT